MTILICSQKPPFEQYSIALFDNTIYSISFADMLKSIYVIGKYLGNNQIFSNIFVQIGLAIAMIYIAFMPNSLRNLFKYIVIFYLTSFVFGGCAFALLYYIKPQEILYNNGQLTRNISNKNCIFRSNSWTNIFKYCL